MADKIARLKGGNTENTFLYPPPKKNQKNHVKQKMKTPFSSIQVTPSHQM